MLVSANNNTEQSENKVLTAESSAEGAADADDPRKVLLSAWQEWICDLAPWCSMITFTIALEHMCFKEGLVKRVRSLVQITNRDLYGKNYYRKVGHSYYSHVIGMEYTTLDVNHCHMIVDMPVNFSLIHTLWNHMSGFCWIDPIPDRRGAVDYISKYATKENDLIVYKKLEVLPCPFYVPWYHDNLPDGHPHKDFFLSKVR